MIFFLAQGYRVIADKRRGHGRSSQTATGNDMDTYAADVAELAEKLDLMNAIHVGHSTGGGEVTRYVAQHARGRVAKAAIISAIPPVMVKKESNPGGRLSTLAGMAVVFPLVMLQQMMSQGAMGGGISSAIARALGAGRREAADAYALHAVIINAVLGALSSALVLTFGVGLYRLLGGSGASLDAALAYSNVVFGGIVVLRVMNALASVIRATGNMLVPGIVIWGAPSSSYRSRRS